MISFLSVTLISSGNCNRLAAFILGGMILGGVGDLILLKRAWLLGGLVTFLFGHLLYTIGFYTTNWSIPLIAFIPIVLLTVLTALFIVKNMSKEAKGTFSIPLAIYTAVITLMFISAFNHDLNFKPDIYYFSLGALAFIISDCFLAWHYFVKEYKLDHLVVHSFYYLAQLLILLGTLRFLVAN